MVTARSSLKRRKMLPFSAGMILAWICGANSAYALNGLTVVDTCTSCATTADFVNEGAAAAEAYGAKGTYYVISASQASSAFIQVNGHFVTRNGEQLWLLVSATPIDSSGNSLAANSESANESYFAALDQVLWGVSRNNPIVVDEPPAYAGSFINTSDDEITPGISNALLLEKGINPNSIDLGTVITVKFQDGTSAQYQKVSKVSSYMWQWNGTAHNKDGKLIDRAGNLKINPNTAGAGAGNFTGPGFFTGSSAWFQLTDPGYCEYGGHIITGDGTDMSSFAWGPC